jgi:hypothetical protein
MKRITLATTLLAATASLAQAQAVQISGEGRMGVLYETIRAGAVSASGWTQENRLALDFNVAVNADQGLSFGAYSRVQIDNGSTGRFSGSNVYAEAGGFRLSFGNLDGAILTAGTSHGFGGGCGIGYVGGHYCADSVGLVGLFYLGLNDPLGINNAVLQAAQTQEFDYTGGGSPALIRADYSFGGATLSLSHERGGATEFGARGTFDAITVALGYANRASLTGVDGMGNFVGLQVPGSVVTASGHYNGGSWGVGLIGARIAYSGVLSPFSHTNVALSGNVDVAGGSLYAYVGRVHHAGVGGLQRANAFGVNYGYDLGGGATLSAGVEQMRFNTLVPGGARLTSGSVGVAFNF